MITNLVLFEHPSHVDQLYPFSILHLPWELRFGAFSIIEAWKKITGVSVLGCFGRAGHVASFYARFPEYHARQLGIGNVLLVSSRLLPTNSVLGELRHFADAVSPVAFTADGELVAALLPTATWEQLAFHSWNDVTQYAELNTWTTVPLHTARCFGYLWELLDLQANAIAEQFDYVAEAAIHPSDYAGAQVAALNGDAISVGEHSSIAPFVVLDATRGPILIGRHVTIMPHTTIIGPCAIDDHVTIKAGTTIYAGCSIGRWCKIGGEIESAIFQDYSNKQHSGFVGHSIIGEWVNLGADTNTSNLKNTYRPIAVELPTGRVSTGRTFLGLLCGDHTKAGINTMFSTGTIVGICANVFGAGYTPSSLPSFTWGGIDEHRLYGIDAALDTVRRAMSRRNRVLTAEEEALIRIEFERVAGSQELPRK